MHQGGARARGSPVDSCSTESGTGLVRYIEEDEHMAELAAIGIIAVLAAIVLVAARGLEKL